NDYFFYQNECKKQNDTKQVVLKSRSKNHVQQALQKLNRTSANRNIADDLEYEELRILYNQKLEKRKKDEAFRKEIEKVIWPCHTNAPEPGGELIDDATLEDLETQPAKSYYHSVPSNSVISNSLPIQSQATNFRLPRLKNKLSSLHI
ncbi:MAG: hypothetical protein ACPGYY_03740, partial [Bacteroidia bacterium]